MKHKITSKHSNETRHTLTNYEDKQNMDARQQEKTYKMKTSVYKTARKMICREQTATFSFPLKMLKILVRREFLTSLGRADHLVEKEKMQLFLVELFLNEWLKQTLSVCLLLMVIKLKVGQCLFEHKQF